MPKISIIIPVYNTEIYLKKCLDSVLNQSFTDYEIIIVNDGSTDNSKQIIEEYAKQYENQIHAYNKENEGVAIARNFGIEKANGQYITFVDSDDYIEPNMLEKMINKAEENDYDMVICDLLYKYPKKDVVGKNSIKGDLLNKEQIKNNIINILPAMCGKLIKRDLFNHLKFKPNIWFEDVEIYFRMYPHLNKIGYINEVLYLYPQRDTSITYTYNEKLYDIVNIWEDIINYYKENNYLNIYHDELEFSTVRYCFATFIKRLSKAKDKKMFKSGVEYVIKYIKNIFPDYKKNKYLKKLSFKNMYLKYFNKCIAYMLYYISYFR